ncbi:hypothetical protein, partial [Bifidobacterium reuteri]
MDVLRTPANWLACRLARHPQTAPLFFHGNIPTMGAKTDEPRCNGSDSSKLLHQSMRFHLPAICFSFDSTGIFTELGTQKWRNSNEISFA